MVHGCGTLFGKDEHTNEVAGLSLGQRVKESSERRGTGFIKSLGKALRVLDCFSEQEPQWRVTDLARTLQMPKSTVSNILTTLEAAGYVRQTPDGSYRLGLRVFELGFVARSTLGVREHVLPILEEVLRATDEIVYLTIPREGQVLYIEALYPTKRLIQYSIVGRTGPMHCTGCGKAMLAYLRPEEVKAVVHTHGLPRFTDATITTWDDLMVELDEIRRRGYAIDRGEHSAGVRCVAAPILGPGGRLLGAISLSGPPLHMTEERIPRYAAVIQRACGEIASQGGLLELG